MSVIADLLVKISGDSSDLRKELNAVQRQIKTAFGSDAVAASKRSLASVKYLAAGFIGGGVAAVKFAADMEQTTMAFKTLLGSSEAAKAMVKDLTDFAAKTPFQMPGITKSTQQMLAYGFSAKEIIPTLTSVGDATSSLGGNDETMQSIIRALGQMRAKAKVSAEEMKQLGEQGINAWKYLAEASGKSIGETQELAKKGAFNAEATIKVILDGMAKQFKGGMEEQSKTINGLLSTIQDNAVGAARVIGNSIAEALDLKDVLKKSGAYLTEFTKLAENSGITTALKDMVPESVKIGVVGLASAFAGRLVPALYIATLNSVKTNATMLRMMGTTTLLGLAIGELSGVMNVLGPMGESFLQSAIAAATAYKGIKMLTSGYGWLLGEISAAYGPLNKTNTIVAQMAQAFMFARIKIVSAGGAMAATKGVVYGLAAAFKSLAVAMGPIGWLSLAIGASVGGVMYMQMKETERQAKITEDAIKKVNGEFAKADSTAVQKAIQASEKKLADLEAQAKKTSTMMREELVKGNTGHKSRGAVKNIKNTKDRFGTEKDQIAAEKGRLKELNEIYKQRKEVEDQLKAAGNTGNVIVPDLLGAGDGDEKAKKKRETELKRLREEAKRTSDSIEDEWIQMTGTKMDVLDKWYRDETASLEKTKGVNENYQRDMTRLEETYSEKRRLILHQEAKEKQRTIQEITTGYADLFNSLNAGGLKGANKDLYEMTQQARDDYKGASDFFAKINAEYADGTEMQKQNIIEALDAAGVAYQKTGQDGLDFTQSLFDYELERFKQLQDEKLEYFRQCKDIQAEIDEAYNKSSLSQLKALLTKENTLRLSNLSAQKAAMDLYYDSWTKSHISTSEQITNSLDDMRGSIKTLFSDLLTGSQTFGETLLNFFEDIGNSIVNSFAEKWSNQIVNGMMGWFNLGGEGQGAGSMLGGSILNGATGGGGLLGGLGGMFSGGFNVGGIFGGLTETTNMLNDTMGTFGSTVLNNTGSMGLLGSAVQGGAGMLRGFNVVQGMINATTKPTEAATTAAATAAISALTPAAFAAAAALNSVGRAGLGSIFGLGFATGGPVFGAGTATSDSIPAMLSNGEYVLSAAAVDKLGVGFLNRLNSGEMPALAAGGLVTGPPLAAIGVQNYGDMAQTGAIAAGKKDAGGTEAEPQPQFNLHIQAMDAKSFEGWLEDAGGKALRKFIKANNREFATLGG